MVIGIASDHRGYKVKEKIKKYLTKKKINFIDYGTYEENNTDDYNDFAYLLCKGVLNGEVEKGILICGTGIGMSIAANKMKGIMCAKVDNYKEARLAREHNHANVIAIGSSKIMMDYKDIIDAFLKGKPIEEEKYLRRIDKIKELEKKRSYN